MFSNISVCLMRDRKGVEPHGRRGEGELGGVEGGETEQDIVCEGQRLCSIKGKYVIQFKVWGKLNYGNLDLDLCFVDNSPPLFLMPQIMNLRMTMAGDT